MEEKKISKLKKDDLADKMTKWLGSVPSLIVHTVCFVAVFILGLLGFDWEMLLLVLTTAVSLEAIYLAIFIQMSVNRTSESLAEVGEDIEEIQTDVGDIAEDVGEIAEDVEDIAEDVGEIQTDVDELQEDIEEIQVDVSDIQKDIDDIQGEVDDMSEDVDYIAKGDKKGEKRDLAQKELLKSIHKNMNKVKGDLERLKASKKPIASSSSQPKKKVKHSLIKKIIKKKRKK